MRSLTTLALSFALASGAAERAPRPEDFAKGWDIHPQGEAAYRVIALDNQVLAASRAPRHADIAVFDADGRRVPSFLVAPPPVAGGAAARGELRWFSAPERAREAAAGRVQLAVDAEANTVQVTLDPSRPNEPPPGPQAWYAAVAEAQRDAQALDLRWQGATGTLVARARLETSDDLVQWSQVGQGAIAQFEAGGERMVRDRIRLFAPLGAFLRLTIDGAPATLAVTGGVLVGPEPAATVERRTFEQVIGIDVRTLELDLGAPLPIDRFEVVWHGAPGIVHARLASRAAPTDPWSERGRAIFHSLGSGDGADQIALAATEQRYWKVEVEGLNGVPASVRLAWRPLRLVFLAQGTAPFQLVAGSAAPGLVDPEQARIDQELGRLWSATNPPTVEDFLGAPTELAGEEAYSAPLPEDDRMRYLLWGVLAAGVVLVLIMAHRVRRELAA